MSSDAEQKVLRILQDLQTLRQQLEVLASNVQLVWPNPLQPTYPHFVAALQTVVSQLCAISSSPLSPADAQAKAFAWLDAWYPHTQSQGSDAAFLDFVQFHDHEPIEQALLAGFMAEQQQLMIRSLLARELGHGWELRYNLTREFLARFGDVLPASVAKADPAQFTDSLENLLLACGQ